jgi:ParB family chromosome partitioning protein
MVQRSEDFRMLRLEDVQPNRLNPRLEFSKQELDELSDSIRTQGLLEPIIVRPRGKGFEVVIGERRYRASHQAGLKTIPAIVRDYTDEEVIELNLIENIQRADLSAVEKAKSCKMLRDKFPEKYGTWEKVAKAIGVELWTVEAWVRTLLLPEEVQTKIAPRDTRRVPEGKVDYQTALHVVERVKEKPRQIEIIQKIASSQIPQRMAQEVIKKASKEPKKSIETVVKEVFETPAEIPFRFAHVGMILRGKKTQTSRHLRPEEQEKMKVGRIFHASIFEPHFADLKVVKIGKKHLRDFTDEDAKREGYATLGEFKEVWKGLHEDWNPNDSVDVVEFELVKRYPNVNGIA